LVEGGKDYHHKKYINGIRLMEKTKQGGQIDDVRELRKEV
jgi:hypothetical protein